MARVDLLSDGSDTGDGRAPYARQPYVPPAVPGVSAGPVASQPYPPPTGSDLGVHFTPPATPRVTYGNPTPPQPYAPPTPTSSATPIPLIPLTHASLTTQFANNPDYQYVPGFGYVYKGYNNRTGTVTGTPNITIAPTADNQSATITGPNSAFDINAWGQNWLRSGGKTLQDWQAYVQAHPLGAGYSLSGSKGDKVVGPNGQGWDAVIGSGLGGQGASWNPFGGGASSDNGNVFTDPATSQWESMLRTLSDRLNQPVSNTDYAPLVGYLRKYFNELQGPAYTPAQSDLLQTQAIDPLTRQRDAARQQTMQRLSARGIDPRSGVAEAALRDVDRQYEQMATQQRSGFAANAVGLEKQQHQQAAGIGNALNQLETARTAADEQRALQSLQLMFQIPQLADQRMAAAQGVLQPVNPLSALSMFPNFGQLGLNADRQTQEFWAAIAQALSHVFPTG